MLLLLGPSLPQWLDVVLLNSDLLLSLFHFTSPAENTKHTPEVYQSEVITLINYCSIHLLSHLQKCYSIHYLFCVKEFTLHSYSYPLGHYLRPHLEICENLYFSLFSFISLQVCLCIKHRFVVGGWWWVHLWFRDSWRCCLTNISSIRTSVESSFGGDSR